MTKKRKCLKGECGSWSLTGSNYCGRHQPASGHKKRIKKRKAVKRKAKKKH